MSPLCPRVKPSNSPAHHLQGEGAQGASQGVSLWLVDFWGVCLFKSHPMGLRLALNSGFSRLLLLKGVCHHAQ